MKKALSFILTVALLLTSVAFVFPASAEAAAEPTAPATPSPNTTATGLWSNYAATSFAGGIAYGTEGWGTAENPYQISTAAELAYLAVLCNTFDTTKEFTHGVSLPNTYKMLGQYFVLTADIDLSAHAWVPIAKSYSSGNYANWPGVYETIVYEVEKDAEGKDKVDAEGNPVYKLDAEGNKIIDTAKSKKGKQTRQWDFSGTFDGQNHKITGLTFNKENLQADGTVGPEYGSLALFGCVRNPGVVKNVYVESSVEIDGWLRKENAETKEMELVPAGTGKAGTFKFMSSNFAGAIAVIAGGSYGGTFENITINAYRKTQGHATHEILNTGFVGYATWNGAGTYTTIKNCVAYGELSTLNAIPHEEDAKVTNSGFQPMTSAYVGRAGGACVIEDCTNYANIFQNTKNTNCIASNFVGKTTMGGYAPVLEKYGKDVLYFENCVNYGNTYVENFKGSSSNTRAGAFLGNAGRGGKGDVLMYDCVNYGDIGASFMGGSSGVASLIGLTETKTVEAYYCFSYTLPHLDDAAKALDLKWIPSLITNAGGGSRWVNGVVGSTSGKYTKPATCAFLNEGVNSPIAPVLGGRLLLNPDDETTANLRIDFNIGDSFWDGFIATPCASLSIKMAVATQDVMDAAATAANSTKASAIVAELTKEGSTYDYELIDVVPNVKGDSIIYQALRNLSKEAIVGGTDADEDGTLDEGSYTVVDEFDKDFVAVAYMVVTNPTTEVEYVFDTDYTVGDEDRVANVYDIASIYYNDMRYDAQNDEGTYFEVADAHKIDGKGNYSYFATAQLNVIKGYLPDAE